MMPSNDMTPSVTVLMPVFNAQNYLRSAIESILKQSFRDFELLIIDDGSRDKSLQIVQRFAKEDKRVRIIRNTTHKGLVKTLNHGLKLAKAPLVARMDSDDIASSDRLRKQYQFLSQNPQFVAVGSNVELIDADGNFIRQWKYESNFKLLKWRNLLKSPLAHPAVMYRKKEVLGLGGYRESAIYYEDHDLWSRVIEKYPITNIQETLLQYRIHGNSITQKHKSEAKTNILPFLRRNIQNYLEMSLEDISLLKRPLDLGNLNFVSIYKKHKLMEKLAKAFIAKEKLNSFELSVIRGQIKQHRLDQVLLSTFCGGLKVLKKQK
jgi:glycosyltransferase involved in cell wall biosynthesis